MTAPEQNTDDCLFESAGKHYDKGVEIYNGKDLEGQWTLAIGEFDKAIEALEKIQTRDEDTIENLASAYRQRSECYLKVREVNKAWMDVQASFALDKEYAWAWHTMGLVYIYRAENQKAIQCLEKAATLEPEVGMFHFNMGLCYKKLGKQAVFIRCLAEAKRLGFDPGQDSELAF